MSGPIVVMFEGTSSGIPGMAVMVPPIVTVACGSRVIGTSEVHSGPMTMLDAIVIVTAEAMTITVVATASASGLARNAAVLEGAY